MGSPEGVVNLLDACEVSSQQLEQIEGVSEQVFVNMVGVHRSRCLAVWRETYGFHPEYLSNFRAVFRKVAGLHAGCQDLHVRIPTDELQSILSDCGYEVRSKKDRWVMMRGMVRAEQ